jgi:arsenite methyltransferase
MTEIREAVRQRYAGLANQLRVSDPSRREPAVGEACCAPGTYSDNELASLGLGAGLSLGCGNPTLLANLHAGEKVLDLGSGGGLDVLLSARRVAPGGHAYGVDMTDEMLDLAERNRAQAGVENVTFLKGAIEEIPLPDAAVDVVISNCVINLAAEKGAVLREAFRVIRPGGRFAVADMVEVEPLAPEARAQLDAWAGCISGTIPQADYERLLALAGFVDIAVEVHSTRTLEGQPGMIGSAYIRARKPA